MFKTFNEINKCITSKDVFDITGFNPINLEYYQKAFIHKSVLRFLSSQNLNNSYERFEFLGDSILNLVIANFIFNRYKNEEEGHLTRIRTKLVNGKTLSYLAKKIKLNEFIIISKNVETIGGRDNDRIIEDVFEAFICAIFLDLGFKYAEIFIITTMNKYLNFDIIEEDNNFKDILLRQCQKQFQISPEYELITTTGPHHTKTFTSIVIINGIRHKTGTGKTKKESEQNASKFTLESLNDQFAPVLPNPPIPRSVSVETSPI
jgi:ribonuclease-3